MKTKDYAVKVTSPSAGSFTSNHTAAGEYTAVMAAFKDFPEAVTVQVVKVDNVAVISPVVKAKFH